MSAPEQNKVADNLLPDIPPEFQNGVWLDPEGGEEDCTIRPNPRPRYRYERRRLTGELLQQANGAVHLSGPYNLELPLRVDSRALYLKRETAETRVELCLNLDGTGLADLATGVG